MWGMCRGPWSLMVRQRLYCTALGQAHMPPFGCPVLQGQLAPGLAGSDGIGDVCLKTPGPRDPSPALRSRTQRDQHLPSPLCDRGANVCVRGCAPHHRVTHRWRNESTLPSWKESPPRMWILVPSQFILHGLPAPVGEGVAKCPSPPSSHQAKCKWLCLWAELDLPSRPLFSVLLARRWGKSHLSA